MGDDSLDFPIFFRIQNDKSDQLVENCETEVPIKSYNF